MAVAFQQDNVPCHKEEHNKFKVLTWPANSPDLNLTEYLCDMLDKLV